MEWIKAEDALPEVYDNVIMLFEGDLTPYTGFKGKENWYTHMKVLGREPCEVPIYWCKITDYPN